MKIYIHIGVHKTGTTSIQAYFRTNRVWFRESGVGVYEGMHNHGANHSELHLSCLRKGRDSFARDRIGSACLDSGYADTVRSRIAYFLSSCDVPSVFFSNEGISWMRYADEVECLKSLFGPGPHEFMIILVLRDKSEFIRSYRAQIYKVPGRTENKIPYSVYNIDDDSWIVKFEDLYRVFSSVFGKESISVLDYDSVLSRYRNIIPGILDVMNIEVNNAPAWEAYVHNRT